MVERRVQEEAVVVQLEVFVGLADAALAESQKLLSFGKGAHCNGPFFKSNRHVVIRENGGLNERGVPCGPRSATAAREWSIVRESSQIAKCHRKSVGRGKPHDLPAIALARTFACPYPGRNGLNPHFEHLSATRTTGG